MVSPFRAGIPATDYARQLGVTKERIYQLVKEGKLESYTQRQGDRERVYVVPPQTIEVPVEGDDLPVPAGSGLDAYVAAMSVYNQRLIEPWQKRVTALEQQAARDAQEIGDLKRQVRELQADLRALLRTRTIERPSDG